MPNYVLSRSATINGLSYSDSNTVSSESSIQLSGLELAAAKTGTLTTRTDDDEGVITLTAGHGFSTGTFDVYWSGGVRYGCSLTIATNAATIGSGGAGDVLPIATTAVTVALPVAEAFVVAASVARAILVYIPGGKGVVRFRDDAAATQLAVARSYSTAALYEWNATTGGTNPLGSNEVATLLLSNGSTTAYTPTVVMTYTS